MAEARKGGLLVLAAGSAIGISACGNSEPPAQSPAASNDALARCLASASNEAETARCEEQHFGTEWRKSPRRPEDDPNVFTVGGHLDPRLIHAGIEARLPGVRACYRTALRKDPSLRSASFKVRFVIDAGGHPRDVADAGSRTKDKALFHCIQGELAAMRFPKPEGGQVEVTYPILLSPGDV